MLNSGYPCNNILGSTYNCIASSILTSLLRLLLPLYPFRIKNNMPALTLHSPFYGPSMLSRELKIMKIGFTYTTSPEMKVVNTGKLEGYAIRQGARTMKNGFTHTLLALLLLGTFLLILPDTSKAQKGEEIAIPAITPSILLHELPYTEILVRLGAGHPVCDTTVQTLPSGRRQYTMSFTPANLLGEHAVIEANVIDDTVRSLLARIIPPTASVRNFAPRPPYSPRNMGHATLDDLKAFSKVLEHTYGDPSVSTETYILYLANDTKPGMNVSLKDEMITMEITPALKH